MAAGKTAKRISPLLGALAAGVSDLAAGLFQPKGPAISAPFLTAACSDSTTSPCEMTTVDVSSAFISDLRIKLTDLAASAKKPDILFMVPGTTYAAGRGVYPRIADSFIECGIPIGSIDGVGATPEVFDALRDAMADGSDGAASSDWSAALAVPLAWLVGHGIDGVSNKTAELIAKLEAHIRTNKLESGHIGIVAHSRGCLISLRAINELKIKYPDLQITFTALDPVAGPAEKQDYHFTDQPDIHAIVIRHIGEERFIYPPAHFVAGHEGQMSTLYRPGIHGVGLDEPDIGAAEERLTIAMLHSIFLGTPFSEEYHSLLASGFNKALAAHNKATTLTAATSTRHAYLDAAIADVISRTSPRPLAVDQSIGAAPEPERS